MIVNAYQYKKGYNFDVLNGLSFTNLKCLIDKELGPVCLQMTDLQQMNHYVNNIIKFIKEKLYYIIDVDLDACKFLPCDSFKNYMFV